MILKVKRFNTRRTDVPAQPVAPAPAARAAAAQAAPALAQRLSAAPAAAPRKPVTDTPFDTYDDGFGSAPFPTAAAANRAGGNGPSGDMPGADDIDAIRREGLTGRQLRMARRMAQKFGLPATSDFDAIRLLRAAGMDPFRRSPVLEIVAAQDEDGPLSADPARNDANLPVPSGDGIRLPQTIKPMKLPAPDKRAEDNHAAEIMRIQQDLARRRRRRSVLMIARLIFFVLLPGLLAGIYYYKIATPLYSTKSEFIIQTSAPPTASGGGLSSLMSSPLANMLDSIAVQGYLQSRDAMLRLNEDKGFRQVFSDPAIDPIQRLDPAASSEDAYRVYQRNVRIAYDPTEGIVKLEVIAPDPQLSVQFAQALIGYAEEQVDHLTQRLREDQMKGALDAFTDAEAKMMDAQRKVVDLQERFKILSSEAEVGLITSQIGQLNGQLTIEQLSLAQMESNASPNAARMDPVKRRIATLEDQIATLRAKLTQDDASGQSLAKIQSELLIAQADVQTRQLLMAQSLQAMETSRIEANRQVRYLSLSVSPVAPDEAAYPRAFENTTVALLIFAGIYLLLSMTAAILREQVSS
jgi:capsular polysaccharide transport system permease protein